MYFDRLFCSFSHRSISVPGPVPNLENLSSEELEPAKGSQSAKITNQHRNFSFNANGQRAKNAISGQTGSGQSRNRKLKRSETERLVHNPVNNIAAASASAILSRENVAGKDICIDIHFVLPMVRNIWFLSPLVLFPQKYTN